MGVAEEAGQRERWNETRYLATVDSRADCWLLGFIEEERRRRGKRGHTGLAGNNRERWMDSNDSHIQMTIWIEQQLMLHMVGLCG